MTNAEQTATTFSADAFAPLAQDQDVQSISRPSLSYWQDAWLRLRANRRALISLWLVVGLLLFTFLGPVIWQIDPTIQDVEQISQAPGANRSVTLVAEYEPWQGQGSSRFAFAETPTTQSVRLQWENFNPSYGYRVYRTPYSIGPERAFGLPLAETLDPFFEDRLDLRPMNYYYTVMAIDADGANTNNYHTIEGTVARVITLEDARSRGLVTTQANPPIGTKYEFAWHPLGTDYLGRDMLARLMHGARVSLFIGFFAPFLYVLIGVIYGSTAGFIGGVTDQAMMRFADFVVALPFLLFMILFKVMTNTGPGESGIIPMLFAMVVLLWPATARLVRGQILQIREEGYISAGRLLGAKTNYLVLRHMIPNTMGVILVTVTFAVPSAIFTEAFLSFIGMGVAPPTPSWGSMCNEGIKTMLTHPHELIFPALFISITVLAFNMLGDGLRDALDARMRNRE
ncbi:MAG: ABC transporter permease [Pseudomonadales bacterium]|nr:ABC transporter permease [Pseudomonadales bacterium]